VKVSTVLAYNETYKMLAIVEWIKPQVHMHKLSLFLYLGVLQYWKFIRFYQQTKAHSKNEAVLTNLYDLLALYWETVNCNVCSFVMSAIRHWQCKCKYVYTHTYIILYSCIAWKKNKLRKHSAKTSLSQKFNQSLRATCGRVNDMHFYIRVSFSKMYNHLQNSF